MLVLSVIYFSIQLAGILLIFEKEQEDESVETITSTNEGNINESEASSEVVLVNDKEEKEVKVNSLGIKLVKKRLNIHPFTRLYLNLIP